MEFALVCKRDRHGCVKAGVVFEEAGRALTELELENFKLQRELIDLRSQLETSEARRLDMVSEVSRLLAKVRESKP